LALSKFQAYTFVFKSSLKLEIKLIIDSNKTPEEVRKDPSGLKGLTIKQVVDSYDKVIAALPSKPIIMGQYVRSNI
jgi:hypothetical protein